MHGRSSVRRGPGVAVKNRRNRRSSDEWFFSGSPAAAVGHPVALGPRELGISHTWLQKLVREFKVDSSKMWQLQRTKGDPKIAEFSRGQEYSRN